MSIKDLNIKKLKKGYVDVDNIEKYSKLKETLTFLIERLDFVSSERFAKKFDTVKLGDFRNMDCDSTENNDYLIFDNSRCETDREVAEILIKVLIEQVTKQVNDITTQINELVKS